MEEFFGDKRGNAFLIVFVELNFLLSCFPVSYIFLYIHSNLLDILMILL